MQIKSESFSEASSLEDLITFLSPVEGSVSEAEARRFHDYPHLEKESDVDYLMRVCSDILVNFYNISEFSSPMVFKGAPNPIPGLKFILVSQKDPSLYFDLCVRFVEYHVEGTLGCSFVAFPGPEATFPLDHELPTFFSILPKICTWDPWEPINYPGFSSPVYRASVIAPEKYAVHFITDCIVRFLSWLKETKNYVPARL